MPGVEAKHEYRCMECGYGAIARAAPAHCPMCQTTAWELAPWRPFSRSLDRPAVLIERIRRERPPVEARL
jgi:hypothetical protein